MEDDDSKLLVRTKQFALRVIRLVGALAQNDVTRVIGRQLLRSGTSVGAHYREACRARSVAEFISKMEVGLQELEESIYWIELLVESNQLKADRVADLVQETSELTAMFVTSINTAKKRRNL